MKKVLHVNDDPIIQLLVFKRMFEKPLEAQFGAIIIDAENAEQAMKLVNSDIDNEIALAIIDLRMPNIDGLLLSKMVYEVRPDIPIIISSSIGLINVAEASLETPTIKDCIELPHVVEDVLEKLKPLLKMA